MAGPGFRMGGPRGADPRGWSIIGAIGLVLAALLYMLSLRGKLSYNVLREWSKGDVGDQLRSNKIGEDLKMRAFLNKQLLFGSLRQPQCLH